MERQYSFTRSKYNLGFGRVPVSLAMHGNQHGSRIPQVGNLRCFRSKSLVLSGTCTVLSSARGEAPSNDFSQLNILTLDEAASELLEHIPCSVHCKLTLNWPLTKTALTLSGHQGAI